MFAWGVFLLGVQGDGPKAISLDYVITVLGALLGLGTLRTVEKMRGTNS